MSYLPEIITTSIFTEKVKQFLEKDDKNWGIQYDIDYDRIKLVEVTHHAVVSYWSPVLCTMSSEDYTAFRAELEALIPYPDWAKGRYW